MDHTTPPPVNPAELKRAQAAWVNFTEFSKYGLIAIIGLLVLMALFLL